MPTNKKRIQIPVSDRVHKEMEKLAKKRGLSLSSLGHSLLEEALETQEDIYFSRVGDEAFKESNDKELISHDDAWS